MREPFFVWEGKTMAELPYKLPVAGYLFSRPGLVKIDVAPHGGDWEKLVRLTHTLTAIEAVKTDLGREVALLRDVYESARQLVRFYGIDKERFIAAGAALDSAIEAVKDFDGGTDEQEN
jgi:hypothetical protein